MAVKALVSPLAPQSYPTLPVIDGVRFHALAAGIRYADRTDVTLAIFDKPAAVAGVLTTSRCPSAAVDLCREHLDAGLARVLIVNSGNANAFTGQRGKDGLRAVGEAIERASGAPFSQIFMASTGVIGEPLDASRITRVVDTLVSQAKPDGLMDMARAIMTTDTYPKIATRTVRLGSTEVTINGIAKGSGMIAPDMATMLSFLFTDAPIAAPVLQALLKTSVATSFNAISVDSDTSTSDTLLFFATGAAQKRGAPSIEDVSDPSLASFARAVDDILHDLALQVVRDGEGARHMIEVRVEGAETDQAAKKIAFSIANSPLVKTAIAGEDANWGRVVAAIGKAGEQAERDRLEIYFGALRLAHEGLRDPSYDEAAISAYMKNPEIVITVKLHIGNGQARVWTCDLTEGYIAINGHYRS